MLALQRIREEPEAVRAGVRLKGERAPIDEILTLDAEARRLRADVEQARAEQRRVSDTIRGKPTDHQRAQITARKQRIQAGESELSVLEPRINDLLLHVPNLPHESVPAGADETGNLTIRTWGKPAEFDFAPLPHHELGERLGIFDFDRAAKISGSRFAVLRGPGARLQRALSTFMLDTAGEHGYTEIAPPYLVRREAMVATGGWVSSGMETVPLTG